MSIVPLSSPSTWYQPHPYGILPLGNAPPKSQKQASHSRFGTLSPVLGRSSALSEQTRLEILCDMMTLLSPADICRVSACSTGFYMLIHASDVWKQIYHNLSPSRLIFEDSWKASAVRFVLRLRENKSSGELASNTSEVRQTESGKKPKKAERRAVRGEVAKPDSKNFKHAPLRVSRDRVLYHDTLFQSWLCTILPCTYKLSSPPGLRSRLRTIPKLTNVSIETFDKYEAFNQPIVITDVADKWPLFRILQGDLQNLSRRKKEIFNAGAESTLFRCEHTNMTVDEYCRYSRDQTDERPIYLFDAEFRRAMREEMFEVPPCFDRDDFFKLLGPERRPKFQWLIAGPKRGGSSFHIDPNYTNAWNACLTGKKRWIMFPPGCVPCGIYPSDDMSNVTAPLSLAEWLLNHYEASVDKYLEQGREVIANAGDVVFVPCGWWHYVINLEDSVAITQNYVSRNNVAKVLLFLQKLPKSISGIGEDEENGEAMSAERRRTIASEFENAMLAKYPDVLRDAMAAHQEVVDEDDARRGRRKRTRSGDEEQGDSSTFAETLLDADSAGFSFAFDGL